MCVYIRISDASFVLIATLLFSGVCVLTEKQHRRDRRETFSSEEEESQTFDPSLTALSHMDYEVLGSNGFSITDFTQTANFSDSVKTDKLPKGEEKNIKETSEYENAPTTKIPRKMALPLFSPSVPQRSSVHNSLDLETITDTPKKDINRTHERNSSTIFQPTIEPLSRTADDSFTPSDNPIQFHERKVPTTPTTIHHGHSTQKNRSNSSKVMDHLPPPESHNNSESVNTTEVEKTELYLKSKYYIAVTNRTLNHLYKFINTRKVQSETNLSPSTDILECIKKIIKFLSESSSVINFTANTPKNRFDILDPQKYFSTNDRPFQDWRQSSYTGNATFPGKKNAYTESFPENHRGNSEIPEARLVSSSTNLGLGLKTPSWTTEHVQSESSGEISSLQHTLGPTVVEGRKNTRVMPTSNDDSRTSAAYTIPITAPASGDSSNSSNVAPGNVNIVRLNPSSTEMPQILVNVSGQIRIIRGMIWMYQLNDKESAEYQYYSRKVQRMLEEMFWHTWLAKHIKKIDVHRFRRGSVMVDFRLLVKTERHIQPQEMEMLFNSFLLPDGGFGGFQMDRHYTKFEISEPVTLEASPIQLVDNSLPQWATALIVISGASLVFVVLFCIVTVYGNYPIIHGQNHRRLQEENEAKYKQNMARCTEWERKAVVAYENLSADGIYDLDEVGVKKNEGDKRTQIEA